MKKVVIIGAGPAGLGCAHELTQTKNNEYELIMLEKNKEIGGLSRTIDYQGFKFDIGPHRFFTKNSEVLKLWQDTLGSEFIEVNRLTRILYKNKLFLYPVKLFDALTKLGIIESAQSLISYVKAKLFLRKLVPKTFEEWTTKNFGSKLFRVFFKTYTEKVWGIPCSKIAAEWAGQRIKNLSLTEVVKTALFGNKTRKAKSLVDKFHYPRYGAGYMYETLARKIEKNKGVITNNSEVTKISHKDYKITSIEYKKNNQSEKIEVDYLISSMPLTHFINILEPKPKKEILEAINKLYFRDHITVNLIVNKPDIFPDNWIYVHSPELSMARIANYGNFSKALLENKNYSILSVEYFVFKNDDIWKMTDHDLIELAKSELIKSQFCKESDVVDGFVIRETEAYPTYYIGYKKHFEEIRNYIDKFENLQMIGRAGMYKYNNMDHSIYSGILAARNYLQGNKKYNLWQINEDAEYLEEKQL